ncbi:MAG: DNA mismatch endonuclease Vsr [Gemmatimonadales bacterium]|nr:DNA mismatch endonuclease Vsr [Gemmatimonadales bacterium]MYG20480.1 DNA mismatch endonuclease Vsr [Gemmatimonadales bacterium]
MVSSGTSTRGEATPTSDAPPSAARSANMARIGSKDTHPELVVRRLLHSLGYRFRLHRRDLPGTPDICFPSRRKVIFVHGCFWHRHDGCRRTTIPKTRTSFWETKFEQNVVRDRMNLERLRGLDWEAMVVWECEIDDLDELTPRLIEFLQGDS